MKLFPALFIIVLLSACTASDKPGSVSPVVNGFVTIIGPKEFGKPAAPTKRMIEQAIEACPGAVYRSARPSTADYNTYEYLFRC
jgi:hypothetical protein